MVYGVARGEQVPGRVLVRPLRIVDTPRYTDGSFLRADEPVSNCIPLGMRGIIAADFSSNGPAGLVSHRPSVSGHGITEGAGSLRAPGAQGFSSDYLRHVRS